MPIDGLSFSAGAILIYTVARTILAVFLSIRARRHGEAVTTTALQTLSDGILAMGALLYANAALRPDAPRALMAALLVYVITWESFASVSRVQAWEYFSPDGPATSAIDTLLDVFQGWAWVFMTVVILFLCGIVVASRPEMTDSQKLAPFVGGGVPLAVGLALRGYVSTRDSDRWSIADGIVAILAAGALAFACWAWL